eukprot:TRINITY_DN36755_c0_g2_i1.p1 TRINITY_DN36755_c0_g2~~TRINITY_DN36755_c0_g2_i1.p1  ORF type:complete len:141 (+),score=9.53 TRINITY_DN36755_c0_g2_i1:754-1176(+)
MAPRASVAVFIAVVLISASPCHVSTASQGPNNAPHAAALSRRFLRGLPTHPSSSSSAAVSAETKEAAASRSVRLLTGLLPLSYFNSTQLTTLYTTLAALSALQQLQQQQQQQPNSSQPAALPHLDISYDQLTSLPTSPMP